MSGGARQFISSSISSADFRQRVMRLAQALLSLVLTCSQAVRRPTNELPCSPAAAQPECQRGYLVCHRKAATSRSRADAENRQSVEIFFTSSRARRWRAGRPGRPGGLRPGGRSRRTPHRPRTPRARRGVTRRRAPRPRRYNAGHFDFPTVTSCGQQEQTGSRLIVDRGPAGADGRGLARFARRHRRCLQEGDSSIAAESRVVPAVTWGKAMSVWLRPEYGAGAHVAGDRPAAPPSWLTVGGTGRQGPRLSHPPPPRPR